MGRKLARGRGDEGKRSQVKMKVKLEKRAQEETEMRKIEV